ncbi:transcription antitermination factor NusB [Candidatus Roizmanbacteria bacterium CG_4_10_14_0_2_um_filter_39_13]|uniref:Transcription antitermination factor NusB n=1 Tax=Candidatus Roizmanbacteria bacterium CG_4_10_14_0_2_um_filter_39_13 TaxID=1974825 RepID=A0A2M7TZY3_9BACT|nr:MAG: transcription antitermination factor NusB [Candidatus Roizmanbacteria bacterium CG_4_10_14_0_2_um_filter_39_13]
MDKRHSKRLHIVQNLYALCFVNDNLKQVLPHKDDTTTQEIITQLDQIDHHIQKHAPKYPLDKIAKIDKSILRLAIYELMVEKKEPVKVVINEAIELAKELGNERSYAFINAVLGSINSEANTTQ